MSSNFEYLIEVGCEELPPTSLIPLIASFKQSIGDALEREGFNTPELSSFATPRRLAIRFALTENKTPLVSNKVWGPPAKIAFDEQGKPTKAALAFANKNAIDPTDLAHENDGKQDKLVAQVQTGGDALSTLLPDMVDAALNQLPIPKRMRWGSGKEAFLRPIQWITLLENNAVIDGKVYGFTASNITRGHRFHHPEPITLAHAKDYADVLQNKAYVIASLHERKKKIKEQLEALAEESSLSVVIDDDLLDEVCGLVEWPCAMIGKFDDAFLQVPEEALILSMKEHQKYFHALDKNGKLAPYFFFVANLDSKQPQAVVEGNERVIRPRLADAQFFFEQDLATSLDSRFDKLATLTFQKKLGSVADKAIRMQTLACDINELLGKPANADELKQAARLAKCDLVSLMVYEFPEMQGVAGRYYAQKENLAIEVANAIEQHYLPRDAGDQLPDSITATIIALADRIDTLVGIFGAGLKPSGSKDPFALRRASVAVLRLLTEQSLSLDLKTVIAHSLASYKANGVEFQTSDNDITELVLDYVLDRFTALFSAEGLPAQVYPATRSLALYDPSDIAKRAKAVAKFSGLSESMPLSQANKRVANILAKNASEVDDENVQTTLLKEPAEKALFEKLGEISPEVAKALSLNDYEQALNLLSRLKPEVDQFFDAVMVMADDELLKKNRLRLLRDLRAAFMQIADISVLSAIAA